MILAVGLVLCVLAFVPGLAESIVEAFAPVVNSGSAVIVIAYITGLFVYRRLKGRRNG